jgi:hypothetical protein
MKHNYLYVLLLVITLQGCCDGDEMGRELLSDEERELLPYQEDVTVPFIHSEGFEFNAMVRLENTFYASNSGDDDSCADYIAIESLNAEFSSIIPQIEISLRVDKRPYLDGSNSLQVSAYTFVGYETSGMTESISVNNTVYDDVERYTSFNPEANLSEILISQSAGIIQINYLNGDDVKINL